MEHRVQYSQKLRSKFAFLSTDKMQRSAPTLIMALIGRGGNQNFGIRGNTACCLNVLEVIIGHARGKRNTKVASSCQRFEEKEPGDLSEIEGSQGRKGKAFLKRQEYESLVANDLRFLNVLQAMVGDVHQIPTDKDKCCVLMAIRPTQCQNQPVRSFKPKIRFSHSPQPLVLLPAPRPRGRH